MSLSQKRIKNSKSLTQQVMMKQYEYITKRGKTMNISLNLDEKTNPLIDESSYKQNLKDEYDKDIKTLKESIKDVFKFIFTIFCIMFIVIIICSLFYNISIIDFIKMNLTVITILSLFAIPIIISKYHEIKNHYNVKLNQLASYNISKNILNKPFITDDRYTVKLVWELICDNQYDSREYNTGQKSLELDLSNVIEYDKSNYTELENDTLQEVIHLKQLDKKQLCELYKQFAKEYNTHTSYEEISQIRKDILTKNGL